MATPNRHGARVNSNDIATIGTTQDGEDLTTMVLTAGAEVGGAFVFHYGQTKLNDEEQSQMGVSLHFIG